MSTPINIKIDNETYSAYPQRIIIGHRGDARIKRLVFDADVIAGISQYYVRFLIPDGETVYENALQNVTGSDEKHRFMCDVPAAVTALTGEGYLQWVARTSNGTTIAKSDMVRFTVLESVSDETEPIPTPETTEAAVDRVEKAAEDAIKAAEEAKKAAEEAIEEFAKGTTGDRAAKKTVYLDAGNGDDTNDGLTKSAKMKTLAAAISKYSAVPNLELQLTAGEYANIGIENQRVSIVGTGNDTTINAITVKSGTLILEGAQVWAAQISECGRLYANYHVTFTLALSVSSNSHAYLDGVEFQPPAVGDTVLMCTGGSVVSANETCFNYGSVQAECTGRIYLYGSNSDGNYNATDGGIITIDGLQVAPPVAAASTQKILYINSETGSDENSGQSVGAPLKTAAAALKKCEYYSNVRLQFAAGTYDIGISAENKKIALVGEDTTTTILNGRINIVGCTLSIAGLTVSASGYGTKGVIHASTGSHVYGYYANISVSSGTAQYTDPCLFITTSSQCYLDGATITVTTDDASEVSSVIAVRSSGGSVVGLGYCKISSTICASTTGEIKTIGSTVGGTKIESGGVIYVNGALTTATA